MPEYSLQRGTLFLVVGPNGVGRTSLIKGAKAALGNNGHFIFPRRYITRPTVPGTIPGREDHIPVSESLFDTMLKRGELPLEWCAHNCRYGVPASISEHLNRGRNIVLNVSRTVVNQARTTLSPVCVLSIAVTNEILTHRLRTRGGESEREIQRHVVRAQEYTITGDDVVIIDNSGTLEESLAVFLKVLRYTAPSSRQNIKVQPLSDASVSFKNDLRGNTFL